MTGETRDKVFISYSHKDRKWLDELKAMLQPLIAKGKIEVWDDSVIEAGDKWHDQITEGLKTAKVGLLLVSKNFLASEFIREKELPVLLEAAEKGECRILWLLINDCLYESTAIEVFQAAHDISIPLARLKTTAERDTVLKQIAQTLEKYSGSASSKHSKSSKAVQIGGPGGASPLRSPRRGPRRAPGGPPEAIQIKILSLTAAPENDLLYEQEQDTLLEVFSGFDRERVFLDMPDPVEGTLSEMELYLKEGQHDILHITAHGQVNESGIGYLCLEGSLGEAIEVTGAGLMALLGGLERPPKIVILSSCHSARRGADLVPVARALFDAGIHTVIGMSRAISHQGAIKFNGEFVRRLCLKESVKSAFEAGKGAVLAWEQRQKRDNPQWESPDESEIPRLLTRDEGLTSGSFSRHRIQAPGPPQSFQFEGADHLERGFIGRRLILRRIYKAVKAEGAVVLKGPGGIGKSTLTTRAAAKLARRGYEFIVVQGETSADQILDKICRKASELGVLDEGKAKEVFADQGVEKSRSDRLKLEHLSLLSYLKEGGKQYYYVHRLIAHVVLEGMAPERRKQWHGRAAEYFFSIKDEENKRTISDGIEARYHFLQAEEWEKAADITFSLEDYLTLHGFPQRSMELLRGLPLDSLNDKTYTAVIGQMGSLYQGFGEYDKAISSYQKALNFAKTANDLRDVATVLHQFGMLHHDQGRYDEAGEHYRKAIEIMERTGDISGTAKTLHQLGMLHHDQDRYNEAVEHYRKAMEIMERTGDISGTAKTLHQIGVLHHDQGRYAEALAHYQRSLEITEKIGDISGMARTIGQFGNLFFQQELFAEALSYTAQAFVVFHQLQSPEAQKSLILIKRVREKLPPDQFNRILSQCNVPAEVVE